jgi:hypothetical protein
MTSLIAEKPFKSWFDCSPFMIIGSTMPPRDPNDDDDDEDEDEDEDEDDENESDEPAVVREPDDDE